ncbi:MAG: TrmH family RNA methyltransferase [Spirochaetales bacterium]|nr:TrmH family RNA methyltransferase [Spirochaetales bacterium]
MFTLKKLIRLPYKTRLRKLVMILKQAEVEVSRGEIIDFPYIGEILTGCEPHFPPELSGYIREHITDIETPGKERRFLNTVRHILLSLLGSEPVEWDFILPETGALDPEKRIVFPASVFLEDLRSPFNVGAIFRSAEAFGVSRIYLTAITPSPEHKKALRTSRGCSDVVPWTRGSLDSISTPEGIFALELGGTPIHSFRFPETGCVLIGSEELGLSPEALALADSGCGRVSIPLGGAKRSLNVSVAFGILMFYWYSTHSGSFK